MQLARALTDQQLSDDLLEQGVANALANLAVADDRLHPHRRVGSAPRGRPGATAPPRIVKDELT